jgi:hypothetical protein
MNSSASPFRRRLMLAYKAPIPNYLCFTALESGTFTFTYGSDVAGDSTSVSYSLDGKNWTTINNVSGQEVSVTTPTIATGESVYWKGTNLRMAINYTANKYSWFSSTGRFDVSGDLQSILFDKNFTGRTNTQWGTAYCFCNFFINCTKLINAKDLYCGATKMNGSFYRGMFMGCTSLISTPMFASKINEGVGTNFGTSIFQEIYRNCTSLVNPNWQFPIVNPGNSAYQQMFQNTAVTEARFPGSDSFLIVNIFKGMYQDCSNLISVPDVLPWTALARGCYANLFQNCISLTKAPGLPATNLSESCYSYMFDGCTSLVNVPDIIVNSFTGGYAMEYMFTSCTSLVHCPIKKIPATLTRNCCRQLFDGCTSLVDVCEFPAENSAAICYYQMLQYTKVTYIKMLLLSNSGNSIMSNWVRGVPSSGIFVKHIDATWTTTGNSGVPTNWTVLYYDPDTDKYYLSDKTTECDDHGNPI